MTEPLSRTSALASRHQELGSGLEEWNGMGTAWTYSTDPCDEHDAVREAAGLFDMTPLKKVRVRGPDALSVVDHVATRDLAGIPAGKSAYGAVLTDAGTLADDAIDANLGEDGWLFVHADAACALWDHIVGEGAAIGIMPASFTALDKVRIEAALLFYGYDMTDEHTPWEVGLGWSVSRRKNDFRGKAAVMADEGRERLRFAGISVDHDDALAGGETLSLKGEEVGAVNSPAWSHRMGESLALVHLAPNAASPGTRLEVITGDTTYRAEVRAIPFYDPQKLRTHAA